MADCIMLAVTCKQAVHLRCLHIWTVWQIWYVVGMQETRNVKQDAYTPLI